MAYKGILRRWRLRPVRKYVPADEGRRIVDAAGGDAIFDDVFEHFEGDFEGDIRRQTIDQGDAVLAGAQPQLYVQNTTSRSGLYLRMMPLTRFSHCG